ncbi:MAG: Cgl0159 family (beta/alpha)8-fold protein [Acidimicrobiales bacterium]
MSLERIRHIVEVRTRRPEAIAEAAAARTRRPLVGETGRLVVIAADHSARGILGAGPDPLAMADRGELLDRLMVALARPGVDGLLATADIVDDLLVLGALDEKVVIGSMNRGGLAGSAFELDDRLTGYDPAGVQSAGLDGGKMLFRIDPDDPATVATMEACAGAVNALASRGLMAVVEPFCSRRVDGRVSNDLSPDAMIRAIAVASGLGATSARTWLKVPVVPDMARVMRASTLPALLLGGDVPDDPGAGFGAWTEVLDLPTVCGVAVGRSLLYPPDGNVAGAVDRIVDLVERSARRPGSPPLEGVAG